MSKSATGILQPKGFPGLPEGWVYEYETYPSADNKLQLFAGIYRKKSLSSDSVSISPTCRVLVVSHGIGEHGGRYLHFPHYLQKSVDLVYCPDHRGHGRSEGLRGHVEQFTDYSDDLALSIRRAAALSEKYYGRTGIHVMGHSMGSLILMEALQKHSDLPVLSACVSSTLIQVKIAVPIIKKLAAGVLSNTWGSLQMSTELDASLLSHDPEVVKTYVEDRLVHGKITPRLFYSMQRSMAQMREQREPFQFPLLSVIPLEDALVDPEAGQEFYHALTLREKKLHTYPGFFHESFNEAQNVSGTGLGKERVFEDLEEWIKSHTVGN